MEENKNTVKIYDLDTGITHRGDKAIEVLCKHLPGLHILSRTNSTGDGVWPVELGDKRFDIKIEAKRNTFNQVRPCQYNVLVGVMDDGSFRVIPPNDLVREALKKLGQHTKDALICMNLGSMSDVYTCTAEDLRGRIVEAFLSGEKDNKAKAIAERANKRLDEIVEENRLYDFLIS